MADYNTGIFRDSRYVLHALNARKIIFVKNSYFQEDFQASHLLVGLVGGMLKSPPENKTFSKKVDFPRV